MGRTSDIFWKSNQHMTVFLKTKQFNFYIELKGWHLFEISRINSSM